MELKKEESCSTDSSDDDAVSGEHSFLSCKKTRLKDPNVYGGDVRISIPLGPGINPSFKEIEDNIAFCCKICCCSEELKQKFLKMDDEVVRPGDNSLWHRRCCHRAFKIKEDWIPEYRYSLAILEKKIIRGDNFKIDTTSYENIEEVYKKYRNTSKVQESELHNDDCIEGKLSC